MTNAHRSLWNEEMIAKACAWPGTGCQLRRVA